jgi:hypothetical protein
MAEQGHRDPARRVHHGGSRPIQEVRRRRGRPRTWSDWLGLGVGLGLGLGLAAGTLALLMLIM